MWLDFRRAVAGVHLDIFTALMEKLKLLGARETLYGSDALLIQRGGSLLYWRIGNLTFKIKAKNGQLKKNKTNLIIKISIHLKKIT